MFEELQEAKAEALKILETSEIISKKTKRSYCAR